jgi:predicted transcriptional regulator
VTKRRDGALENEILGVLWSADRPLPPGEIKARLATDLAYTSVATVLGRLHAKGLVRRREAGRAFEYEAVVDESQLAASRIAALLADAGDRKAVLAGFVGTLSKRDAKALRALLDNEPQ